MNIEYKIKKKTNFCFLFSHHLLVHHRILIDIIVQIIIIDTTINRLIEIIIIIINNDNRAILLHIIKDIAMPLFIITTTINVECDSCQVTRYSSIYLSMRIEYTYIYIYIFLLLVCFFYCEILVYELDNIISNIFFFFFFSKTLDLKNPKKSLFIYFFSLLVIQKKKVYIQHDTVISERNFGINVSFFSSPFPQKNL